MKKNGGFIPGIRPGKPTVEYLTKILNYIISVSYTHLDVYKRQGRTRHMGIRPTVRGSVMNPNDHPHGGGEGKTGIGRPRCV